MDLKNYFIDIEEGIFRKTGKAASWWIKAIVITAIVFYFFYYLEDAKDGFLEGLYGESY